MMAVSTVVLAIALATASVGAGFRAVDFWAVALRRAAIGWALVAAGEIACAVCLVLMAIAMAEGW